MYNYIYIYYVTDKHDLSLEVFEIAHCHMKPRMLVLCHGFRRHTGAVAATWGGHGKRSRS